MVKAARAWIIDTNVFISAALLAGRAPDTLLSHLLEHETLWFSESTFSELSSRLMRPKFDRYVSREARTELLRHLGACAQWADPDASAQPAIPSPDPDDNAFLLLAECLTGQGLSTLLVSGDADLLGLAAAYKARGSLRILNVAQACKLLTA